MTRCKWLLPFLGFVLSLSACQASADVTTTATQITSIPPPDSISAQGSSPDTISGIVMGDDSPVSGAIVRVQTTDWLSISDVDGTFSISIDPDGTEDYLLTGWATGYFCSGPFPAAPGEQDVLVQLVRHSDDDHSEYAWLPSRLHPGEGESQGCAECHSSQGSDLPFSLPVDEWLLDAHSQTAQNPRFLTMYNGTDIDGNQSPQTRMGSSRDYGTFPLPPDLTKPYFGPGYKLDFPESTGNCAACHTPAAAINAPYETDPNTVAGVEAEGLPCDFCHKIWAVTLDPTTGLPFHNNPGVLSYTFHRPAEGHQFFAGPFDDVAPGEDTYSELQTQSAFCAPCHFGVFWDTTVYNSFGEWLASPYSELLTGKTCQDCHMPQLGATRFVKEEAGGLLRDPERIFSHRMPGASDPALLQDAVELQVSASWGDAGLLVEVRVFNDNTGHKIPTDSPLRQMLLVVEAFDANGETLPQSDGPRLPDWAGIGDPGAGYFAGQPGKAYALVLQELWTEITPTGAYWNPTRIVQDTRLAPFERDRSTYLFDTPQVESAEVRVRLVLRRAYIDLMDQKGWTDPDMLMAEELLRIEPE